MKYFKHIILLFTTLFLFSCEDVVNVDVPTAAPRLVVDASINWEIGTSGNQQTIRLTTTAGYYEPSVPTVSGAEVFVTNADDNTVFVFNENPGTGDYICNTFIPLVGANYTLTVNYGGQTYSASEKLIQVVPIDMIEQKNDGGFTGQDIEIKVFFTDKGDTDDFYLFRYKPSFAAVPIYEVSDDEFYQGNQFSDFFINEDLKSGDDLNITIYGVSQQHYNYMNLLLGIAGGGGPFATAPAKLKGNIVNTTNAEDNAFGYFRLSQTNTVDYLVQ